MVQGVGFRFTAVRAAEGCQVTGYVRNLPDGTVEVVAEGTPDEIDTFVAEIQQRMSGYIRDTAQQTAEPTGQYAGFGVRF